MPRWLGKREEQSEENPISSTIGADNGAVDWERMKSRYVNEGLLGAMSSDVADKVLDTLVVAKIPVENLITAVKSRVQGDEVGEAISFLRDTFHISVDEAVSFYRGVEQRWKSRDWF